MPTFCIWNRITHVIPCCFRASTANEKLKHDAQTQDDNGMQAMLHYTDGCCMSTFVRTVGRGKTGLWASGPLCFLWCSGHATCSTVETKTIWYTPSLAHCDVVLITSHFICKFILFQMFIFMNLSGLRNLRCRKVSKLVCIDQGLSRQTGFHSMHQLFKMLGKREFGW